VTISFEEAWARSESVEGWLTREQGEALFVAAGTVRPGYAAVEIGSHHGKSAILIAGNLPEGVSLTAVDPFDDPRWGGGTDSLDAFRRNIAAADLGERIELFRGLSEDASRSWKGPLVSFLWVDGAHDLESTLKDFDGWMPHMAPGGLIYVHDAFSAVGTTRAIFQRFWGSRTIEYLGCERTLAQFRVRRLSPLGQLSSGLRMLPRLVFFTRMIAIKVSRRRGWHSLERRFMRVENEPLI